MPNARTATIDTPRSAIDGCSAHFEISQAEVIINPMLLAIVNVPSKTDRTTPRQNRRSGDRSRRVSALVELERIILFHETAIHSAHCHQHLMRTLFGYLAL